jgi:hypothetical protein
MTDVIRHRYPARVRDWFRAKWAIHPRSCSKCVSRMAVCWVATECCSCWPDPAAVIAKQTIGGGDILLHVREIPAMTDQSPDAPDITVHAADGHRIRAGVLAIVAESFHELAKARVEWAAHPPVEWVLERREDGRVWAPVDPFRDRLWRCSALPLRPSVLREAGKRHRELHKAAVAKAGHECQCDACQGKPTERRKCFGCKVVLGTGQTAWRADTSAGDGGWSSEGKSLLWCPSCVSAVQVIAEAAPEETIVRHMRVIEGGAAGIEADQPR